MKLTRLLPQPTQTVTALVDSSDPATAEFLAEAYRPAQGAGVRINLVASIDGVTAGSDGTSNTLTSRLDRTILKVIRDHADVVLVGAQTVRSEAYLRPRTAALAIVTATGDLSGHRLGADETRGRVLVFCPASAADRVIGLGEDWDVIVIDDDSGRLSLPGVLAQLTARGLANVVCEGGPQLIDQLMALDAVDEVCLTTSPVMGGGRSALGIFRGPAHRFTLRALLVDEQSFTYARWARVRPAAKEPGAAQSGAAQSGAAQSGVVLPATN